MFKKSVVTRGERDGGPVFTMNKNGVTVIGVHGHAIILRDIIQGQDVRDSFTTRGRDSPQVVPVESVAPDRHCTGSKLDYQRHEYR